MGYIDVQLEFSDGRTADVDLDALYNSDLLTQGISCVRHGEMIVLHLAKGMLESWLHCRLKLASAQQSVGRCYISVSACLLEQLTCTCVKDRAFPSPVGPLGLVL